MDLNICLYCEKHLPEENMSFCSLECQTNEASKPLYTYSSLSSTTANNDFYPLLLSSSSSSRSSCSSISNSSYEIAYHRRLSFSYCNNSYIQPLSVSSSSSSSSTFSSASSTVKQQQQPWFLLTNSSILLEQQQQDTRLLDLNKQNVYTNHFFS